MNIIGYVYLFVMLAPVVGILSYMLYHAIMTVVKFLSRIFNAEWFWCCPLVLFIYFLVSGPIGWFLLLNGIPKLFTRKIEREYRDVEKKEGDLVIYFHEFLFFRWLSFWQDKGVIHPLDRSALETTYYQWLKFNC